MPAEMAHDSDFLGCWFQVRLVERTRPVRQFAFAVWAGEYPVLIDRVWTLKSPVPQDLRQSQIERNRFARGFGLTVAHVLHDDRGLCSSGWQVMGSSVRLRKKIENYS
jgi:hypothetical protein